MIKCTEILLSQVSPFKSERALLTDNEGLVVVTGHNKDSRIANDQINGSGKSRLLSSIPNCRYGGSPSSVQKNSKKDMLNKTSSKIGFRFIDVQGRKIQFVQTAKNWQIFIDGVDQQVHRIEHQMAKMAELFPLSEEEFYSHTYLSSTGVSHLHFQAMKPADRLKFFTTVFHLDDYDKMKKYFTKQLAKIKEEQVRFDVIASKLFSVTTSLAKLNWDEEKAARLKKVDKLLAKISADLELLSDEKNALTVKQASLKTSARRIQRMLELQETIGENTLESVKAKIAKAEAYAEYCRAKQQYTETKDKIQARLDKLNFTLDSVLPDPDEIKVRYKAVKARRLELNTQYSVAKEAAKAYRTTKERLDELKAQIKKLGFASPKDIVVPDDLQEQLEICRTTVRLKKLLDSDVDSHCPTCQQPVDIKKISAAVKKAAGRLASLENIDRASALFAKYKELSKTLGEPVDVEALKTAIAKAEKKLDALEEEFQRAERITELLSTFNDLKKPKKVEKVSYDLEKLRTMQGDIWELGTLKKDLDDVDPTNVNKTLKRIAKDLAALEVNVVEGRAKYKRYFDERSKLDVTHGEYKVLTRQQKDYDTELEEVKPILAKREVFKELEKAWGAKGMKVQAANAIATMLEVNLNKYSELVFAEPFKFRVYVNDKGVFCDVDRGAGKEVSDVRLMSGAESECFKLLFMASLLLMSHPNRRTNIAVLDEPDSHMDSATRELLARKFIPFLRDIVPHVFLITAKDPDVFDDFELWTIVKHKGVSKLHIEKH